ncbi:MAG: arsenate reductase ArsC [Acidiferrobacterales bacterium]
MKPASCNVLFLCTGNSARSILAEAILNALGDGRFHAYSAGSHPTGRINPFALEIIQRMGWPGQSLRSKSWDEFAQPGAPRIDLIITVCDSAAREACPVWPARPANAHWGMPDPAAAPGSTAQKRQAFEEACTVLRRRIGMLIALPLERLDADSLRHELRTIPARDDKGETASVQTEDRP